MLAGRTGERENNGRKPVEHRNAFDFKAVLLDGFVGYERQKVNVFVGYGR